KINGFVSFPARAAEYNWFIRLVIVLVSPDARRVKKSHNHELVVRIHATGDEDFLVTRKCDGALAAARQDATVGDRCFIERSEIRSGGDSVGGVQNRYICG